LLPVPRLAVFDSYVGFLEELFCVAGVNYFWHFSGRGLAGWSWSGRALRFRAQNRTVTCFSDRRLSVEVSVKILRSQIACPDSGSGLVLGDFSVAESYLSTLVASTL